MHCAGLGRGWCGAHVVRQRAWRPAAASFQQGRRRGDDRLRKPTNSSTAIRAGKAVRHLQDDVEKRQWLFYKHGVEIDEPTSETPDLMVQVGDRLRVARKAAGLTQKAAADRAGMRQDQLSRMEAGGLDVSLRNLARVAAVLGVSLSSVFDGLDLSAVALESRGYSRDEQKAPDKPGLGRGRAQGMSPRGKPTTPVDKTITRR